MIARTFISLIL